MGAEMPEAWRQSLARLPHDVVDDEHWSEKLRGVESQNVAIVLTADELAWGTEGFEGAGRSVCEHFRLLRIPFSRARESLAVFAV